MFLLNYNCKLIFLLESPYFFISTKDEYKPKNGTFMIFFDKDCLLFLKELSQNNNREWFNKNKERYIKSVKEPFKIFIQHMIYKIQEDNPNLIVTPKEAIFRIYRDVRFSKDKSPYKTQLGAVIANGGRKSLNGTEVYIEISPQYVRLYSGIYQLSKENLYNLRTYIAKNLTLFNKTLNDKKFKRTFKTILGDRNKRLPKEFQSVFEKQPLIANKQFYFYKEEKAELLLSEKLTAILVKHYFTSKPMNTFLKEGIK
ncbi:MAG: hypothetical protein CR986_10145 [Ignavibacteriae bacterium]|nr:MAG: hypothetical protein CR986_10145 [Ignavibacteriota bacterium]